MLHGMFWLVWLGSAVAVAHAPVKLIIDTDIGGGGCNDVDDVVAVCIANALTDLGEAELLAVVQNTAPVKCAGAISVLNHFYGRDAVPIGAYNISTPGATLEQQQPLPYVTHITDLFDSPIRNSSQAEDAVEVYRRVLAAQPDHSVAISSIGIHTNLAALLKSGPDSHSPLSGHALVAAKVMTLAVMGGAYPSGAECNLMGGGKEPDGSEHNHLVASAASSYVASHWPAESKLIWSGAEVGLRVQSGGAGFQQRCPEVASTSNPCAAAMINYEHGPDKSRFSWDPLTTLVAVKGAAAGSTKECTGCDGHNVIDPQTGHNHWVRGQKTNQTYLTLLDGKAAGDTLDELLCHASSLNPHPAPPHPAPPPPPPPPVPATPGLCVVGGLTPLAGAGPPMRGFGGGNYSAACERATASSALCSCAQALMPVLPREGPDHALILPYIGDGDVNTFYDYSKADGGWTEARLSSGATSIAHVFFWPRAGYLDRHVVGGRFVGITRRQQKEVALATITQPPKLGWNGLEVQQESTSGDDDDEAAAVIESVKFLGADGSYGNIAEIKLLRKC
jgi:inosine-uridine nucleoside N-ribohydrolase